MGRCSPKYDGITAFVVKVDSLNMELAIYGGPCDS